MTNNAIRPKGPQPVLDDLVGTPANSSTVNGEAQWQGRPGTAPRTNGVSNPTLARSSTAYLSAEAEGQAARSRSSSPNTRPMLLRAKSDFGPRRDDHGKGDETESKASTEGEWGIRHGFDTQLASEDYNHLLTEVNISSVARWCLIII